MSDQDAMAPRVIVFRHGETEWTKSGQSTSFTEVELTQAGIMQVSSAAARLVGAGKLLNPCRLEHIFVSPRVRTKTTFELLLPSSRVAVEKVTFTEDITEWNYGDYEGLKNRDIRLLRKKRGLDLQREWDIWSDGCEGGESKQQVTERLDRLILQIREIQKPHMLGDKPVDVLLVAHGLILRCFIKRWIGLSVDQRIPMILDPGAIAVLGYKNNDINEPAFHVGIALPSKEAPSFWTRILSRSFSYFLLILPWFRSD